MCKRVATNGLKNIYVKGEEKGKCFTTTQHKRFNKQPTAYLVNTLIRERRNAWVLIRIALGTTLKQKLLSIQKQNCL